MNISDPSSFTPLFEQLLEGGIDDESRARLISLMEENPALLDETSRQLMVSEALAGLKFAEDDEMFVRLVSEHAFRLGNEEENAFVSGVTRRIFLRQVGRFAAVAALVLIPAVAVFSYNRTEKPAGGSGSVAKLIEVDAAGKIISNHEIGKGYKLDKQNGLFRLDFSNGAIVAIEAPASCEVISGWSMRLHSGNLNAWCPETAHGFQVLTTLTKVTDLGTSFGISASENGNADIMVLNGLIDVSAGGDTRRLRAGEALRSQAAGGGLTSVRFETSSFTRTWPLAYGILSTKGSVNPAPPGTPEQLANLEDDKSVLVIPEKRDVTYLEPIDVELTGPGEVSFAYPPKRQPLEPRPGVRIRSYLIRYNPVGRPEMEIRRFEGSVTFDRPVVAVCASGALLDASDSLFATGPWNPAKGTLEYRGIDLDMEHIADTVRLSADRHTVSIIFNAGVSTDDIRVIVEEDAAKR